MNDQMLESEKTISGELRSLTNRLEEANQDKGMFWVIARAKVASSGWWRKNEQNRENPQRCVVAKQKRAILRVAQKNTFNKSGWSKVIHSMMIHDIKNQNAKIGGLYYCNMKLQIQWIFALINQLNVVPR